MQRRFRGRIKKVVCPYREKVHERKATNARISYQPSRSARALPHAWENGLAQRLCIGKRNRCQRFRSWWRFPRRSPKSTQVIPPTSPARRLVPRLHYGPFPRSELARREQRWTSPRTPRILSELILFVGGQLARDDTPAAGAMQEDLANRPLDLTQTLPRPPCCIPQAVGAQPRYETA